MSSSTVSPQLKLAKLSQFANQILEGSTLDSCCEFLFDTFQDVIPFDRIGVSLIDKDTDSVVLKWARTRGAEIQPPIEFRAPLSKSLQKILEDGKPRIMNDLLQYLKDHPYSLTTKQLTSTGMRSNLTCPIRSKHGYFGFLFFTSESKDSYNDEHIDAYQLIASQIGFLLEKLEQEETLKKSLLKEKFFYKCLHDMGNALNIVSCYSKLTLMGKYQELPEKIQRVLEGMDKQIDKTLHLFEELQNFGEVVSTEFSVLKTNVEVAPLLSHIQQASEFLAAKKKINFKMETSSDLPQHFFLDANRISQVMSNLMSNSIKHSLANTTISLKVTTTPKGELLFCLKDEGEGMSKTDIDKLLLDTQSLNETHDREVFIPKKGIGLKICKRIVEAHQGEFWVESHYGMGSSFTFVLPPTSTDSMSKTTRH